MGSLPSAYRARRPGSPAVACLPAAGTPERCSTNSCNSCSRSVIPARTSAPKVPTAPASSRTASPRFEANPDGVA